MIERRHSSRYQYSVSGSVRYKTLLFDLLFKEGRIFFFPNRNTIICNMKIFSSLIYYIFYGMERRSVLLVPGKVEQKHPSIPAITSTTVEKNDDANSVCSNQRKATCFVIYQKVATNHCHMARIK